MVDYDAWKLSTPEYYDNDESECDCCSFTSKDDEDFTEVFHDGRTLWVCEWCLESKKYI